LYQAMVKAMTASWAAADTEGRALRASQIRMADPYLGRGVLRGCDVCCGHDSSLGGPYAGSAPCLLACRVGRSEWWPLPRGRHLRRSAAGGAAARHGPSGAVRIAGIKYVLRMLRWIRNDPERNGRKMNGSCAQQQCGGGVQQYKGAAGCALVWGRFSVVTRISRRGLIGASPLWKTTGRA